MGFNSAFKGLINKMHQVKHNSCNTIYDFKLSPCSECFMLSSG